MLGIRTISYRKQLCRTTRFHLRPPNNKRRRHQHHSHRARDRPSEDQTNTNTRNIQSFLLLSTRTLQGPIEQKTSYCQEKFCHLVVVGLRAVKRAVSLPSKLKIVSFSSFSKLSQYTASLLKRKKPKVTLCHKREGVGPGSVLLVSDLVRLPFRSQELINTCTSEVTTRIRTCRPLTAGTGRVEVFISRLVTRLKTSLQASPVKSARQSVGSFIG